MSRAAATAAASPKTAPSFRSSPNAIATTLGAAIRQAALGKSDIAPVDAALAVDGERFGRFYVTAVEEEERDQETAIVYMLETTEQRELENKVTQQQKMELVGQLAGGIAHDFNNVLSAIMMATDFLLNAHKPTDPSFADIMQIKQNANRAASLVRHLLAFSRKQTLRPQVLDLGEVLSDLTMLLRRLIGEKVTLEVVHGRDLWPVKADISQFEQVIVNLAVNARDAMPNGGRLKVRTANVTAAECARFRAKGMPAADYVLVEVTDTGTGIPAKIVDKIFEPFFSTKEVGKGTGLGLSTVYGIIKQTGGFVYVETAENKGATFRMFLPRHVATAQEIAVEQAEVEAMAGAAADGGKCPPVRSHRAGDDPAGGRRGRTAPAQCPRPRLARLHGARSRQRRRSHRGLGTASRRHRPGGLRRCHAGNGRADAVARIAQPQSRPENYLRVRLCRGRVPEAPARRRQPIRLPGQAVHAQAAGQRGERDDGGIVPPAWLAAIKVSHAHHVGHLALFSDKATFPDNFTAQPIL